jgi:hypothetical protein
LFKKKVYQHIHHEKYYAGEPSNSFAAQFLLDQNACFINKREKKNLNLKPTAFGN